VPNQRIAIELLEKAPSDLNLRLGEGLVEGQCSAPEWASLGPTFLPQRPIEQLASIVLAGRPEACVSAWNKDPGTPIRGPFCEPIDNAADKRAPDIASIRTSISMRRSASTSCRIGALTCRVRRLDDAGESRMREIGTSGCVSSEGWHVQQGRTTATLVTYCHRTSRRLYCWCQAADGSP
jgi:hypothetical protein